MSRKQIHALLSSREEGMDMTNALALVALGGILLLVAWWNHRATKKRMQRRREAMLRCIERLRREQW